jgi:hypothetical protein
LKTKVVDLTEENEEKINRLKNEISQAKEEKKEDDVSVSPWLTFTNH